LEMKLRVAALVERRLVGEVDQLREMNDALLQMAGEENNDADASDGTIVDDAAEGPTRPLGGGGEVNSGEGTSSGEFKSAFGGSCGSGGSISGGGATTVAGWAPTRALFFDPSRSGSASAAPAAAGGLNGGAAADKAKKRAARKKDKRAAAAGTASGTAAGGEASASASAVQEKRTAAAAVDLQPAPSALRMPWKSPRIGVGASDLEEGGKESWEL
jgi:hypothetical protein